MPPSIFPVPNILSITPQATPQVKNTAKSFLSKAKDVAVNALIRRLETLFADRTFTKADVVRVLEEYLPNFTHEEKGRNLDDKM